MLNKKITDSKNINTNGAHNEIYDCEILAELLRKFKKTNQMLLANAKLSSEKTAYWEAENRAINNLQTLALLRNAVGPTIRKISNGRT
jgi:hypothetical protein